MSSSTKRVFENGEFQHFSPECLSEVTGSCTLDIYTALNILVRILSIIRNDYKITHTHY